MENEEIKKAADAYIEKHKEFQSGDYHCESEEDLRSLEANEENDATQQAIITVEAQKKTLQKLYLINPIDSISNENMNLSFILKELKTRL